MKHLEGECALRNWRRDIRFDMSPPHCKTAVIFHRTLTVENLIHSRILSSPMNMNIDNWSLNEWRSNTTPEVRLFRKNLTSTVDAYRSSHGHLAYFTFAFTPKDGSGLPSTSDFDALSAIEETEIDFLTGGEIAVFVAVVTVPGARDFLFYTNSPESFLSRAEAVRDRHSRFQSGCQISPDPSWSQYGEIP